MRWIATADTHFSNNLPYSKVDWYTGVSDRLSDLERLSEFLIKVGKQHRARGLLILGDSFDRNRLDAVTLVFALKWMREIAAEFDEVIVLPGNHESHDARSIHFTNQWLEAFANVRVPAEPKQIGRLALFPYMPLSKLRQALRSYEGNRKRSVLCTHAVFAGAKQYGHTFSDGLRPFDVKGFGLVLSGHIHNSQRLVGINGRYLGSPHAIDFRDDVGKSKKVWLIDDGKQIIKPKPIVVPESIAVPFSTIDVDLFADGSVKKLTRALPGLTGYLRIRVRGAKQAIERFIGELKPKLSDSRFRHVSFARQIVREKVKARAADLGSGMAIDLHRAISVWTNAIELPPHFRAKKLERIGHELLDDALKETGTVARRKVTIEPVMLSVRNFMVIEKAMKLPLDDAGLVLIRANNRDSTGADSNGAGKTTLFKAVTWVLYGRTIYGEVGNDVIRRGAKEARVALTLRVDGKLVVIRRVKTRADSALLAIKREGKTQSGGVGELQDEINTLLGMDFDTFRNAVLFGQDDAKRFADSKTSDSARKSILRDILGLGCLDVARSAAKKAHDGTVEAIEEYERESIRHRALLDSGKPKHIEKQADEWKQRRKSKIKELKSEVRRIRVEIESETAADSSSLSGARKRLDQANERENECNRLHDKLREERHETIRQRDNLLSDLGRSKERVSTLLERLTNDSESLSGKKCPVCDSALSKGAGANKRKEVNAAINHAEKELRSIQTKMERINEKYDRRIERSEDKLNTTFEQLTEAQDKKRKAATKLEKLQARESTIVGLKAHLKEVTKQLRTRREEESPFEELLDKAYREEEKAKQELARLDSELSSLRLLEEQQRFWMDGFGNTGLQSWIMDTATPRLNECANEHLAVLSDGDIQIAIDTESMTKGGASRDKFSIAANIEQSGETNPSGGQQRKIELAVGLGMMDLVREREGANILLLMLDEVLDGLDGTGKQRVMVLLSQLRSRKGSILVISHDPELRGGHDFDSVWTVTKKDGRATVKARRA